MELLESFGINLHRIDKVRQKLFVETNNLTDDETGLQDVARCDRNLPYFQQQHNLDKVPAWSPNPPQSNLQPLQLRNVVTTYVWQNLDIGYMQVRHHMGQQHVFNANRKEKIGI